MSDKHRRYRAEHKDEINERNRVRYAENLAKGVCPKCGGTPAEGMKNCQKHLDMRKRSRDNVRRRAG